MRQLVAKCFSERNSFLIDVIQLGDDALRHFWRSVSLQNTGSDGLRAASDDGIADKAVDNRPPFCAIRAEPDDDEVVGIALEASPRCSVSFPSTIRRRVS